MSDFPDTPLAELMRRHGLRQTEIASAADISQAYLSLLASGRKIPSLPVAMRLVQVLSARCGEDEVSLEALWGDLVRGSAVNE